MRLVFLLGYLVCLLSVPVVYAQTCQQALNELEAQLFQAPNDLELQSRFIDLARQCDEQPLVRSAPTQQVTLSTEFGFDSNALHRSDLDQLTLTLSDGVFVLPIEQSIEPNMYTRLSGRYDYALSANRKGAVWGELQFNEVASLGHEYELGGQLQQSINAQWTVQASLVHRYNNNLHTQWLFAEAYPQTRIGQWSLLAGYRAHANAAMFNTRFVGLTYLYERIWIQWQQEYPTGHNYPGGGSRVLGVGVRYPRVMLNVQWSQDREGYSSLIERNELRRSTAFTAQYRHPVGFMGKLGEIEVGYNAHLSNLKLFTWRGYHVIFKKYW